MNEFSTPYKCKLGVSSHLQNQPSENTTYIYIKIKVVSYLSRVYLLLPKQVLTLFCVEVRNHMKEFSTSSKCKLDVSSLLQKKPSENTTYIYIKIELVLYLNRVSPLLPKQVLTLFCLTVRSNHINRVFRKSLITNRNIWVVLLTEW